MPTLTSKGTTMTEREKLKVSTRVMFDELVRQKIPVRIIDAETSLLEFTDKLGKTRFLFSTSSDRSSAVGVVIANSKQRTEIIARELNITVPEDEVCHSFDEVLRFFSKYNCVVLKPLSNSGGSGVSTNITDIATLSEAYAYARTFGKKVIAQQHINGSDVRLLIVAGTFRSAVERRPATVQGDGVSTTERLIQNANDSPSRTGDYMTAMSLIDIESARRHLFDDIQLIPAKDETVVVVGPANLSMGGTAHEATELVTEQMIEDAEKITRKLGLDLCGVDMIWDKDSGKYYLLEVNATPGIDMHNDPFWGTKSDAIEKYVTWLVEPITV